MNAAAPLAQFTVPWGKQEVTLQELVFDAGGVPLLRVRIREGKRFTIFDIDADSAARWAQAMQAWADGQRAAAPPLQSMPWST